MNNEVEKENETFMIASRRGLDTSLNILATANENSRRYPGSGDKGSGNKGSGTKNQQTPSQCLPCVRDLLSGKKLPNPGHQINLNASKSISDSTSGSNSLSKQLSPDDPVAKLMHLSGNELIIYKQAKTIKQDLDNDPKVQTIYAREKELNTQVNSFLRLFVGFWKKKEFSDIKSFGVVIIPGEYVYTCKLILGITLSFTLIPLMFLFIVPFCIGLLKSETKQVLLIGVALTVIFLLQSFVISDKSKIVIEFQ